MVNAQGGKGRLERPDYMASGTGLIHFIDLKMDEKSQ